LAVIRIVLVELQGIARDVVGHALRRGQGISVVGDVQDRRMLPEALARTHPDLVIWDLDQVDVPDASPELFAEHPRLKVLALERRGTGTLWELRPQKTSVGELSPSLLIDVIEKAFAGQAEGA
jgi:DNA-binding NarL/FixJ family response regulator